MTKAGKRDDEHEEEEEEEDGSGSMETHPKRTTSFVARLTHKKPVVRKDGTLGSLCS